MRTKQTIGLIILTCVLASLAVLAGLIVWLGTMPGLALGLAVGIVVVGMYLTVIGPWAAPLGRDRSRGSPDHAR